MINRVSNTTRIAKNTSILYIRLLFTMCISLYTSRIVLQALGINDFGIYNVVGGVVSMLAFFTSSISSSFQRFFCIEIANKNEERLKQLVGSSIVILFCLSLCVWGFSETLGVWFIKNKMVIPIERLGDAIFVFRFSIFSFIIYLFQSIYNAIIISYEKMSVFAYISIFEVCSKLLVAILLNYFFIDKMVCYSVFLFIVSILSFVIYYSYCRFTYSTAKGTFSYNIEVLSELFKFSGWTFFGTFANVLKSNGLNILLNMFFGPIVNAARGIAYQVYTAVNSFTRSFQLAFTPQLTKSYAQKDFKYVESLMVSTSKMSFYLMFFLSIPIFLDTNFVLSVWLGNNVPEYTVPFVKLVILTGLVESLSSPIVNVIYAAGNIKRFQTIISGIIILVIPISYWSLNNGCSPEFPLSISLFLTVVAHVARMIIVKRYLSYSVVNYVKEVLFPFFLFCLFLLYLPDIISNVYSSSLINYILTVAFLEILALFIIYMFGLTNRERSVLKSKIDNVRLCRK